MRPDKVHALLVVLPVEGVVGGDLDGQAVGVPRSVAALGGLSRLLVLDLRAERDVVVDVLAPGQEHHGHCVVVALVADVDVRGDLKGGIYKFMEKGKLGFLN